MDTGPGFVQGGFILMGVCAGSLALTFVFMALCTRDRRMAVRALRDCPEATLRRKIREYESRYFDELAAAMDLTEGGSLPEEKLESLAGVSIEEETPVGLIRMEYNARTESFEYYTDARNVQYKTLDAVARSFSIVHDCPQLCVNYKDEFYRSKREIMAAREAEAEKDKRAADADAPASTTTSVFAKFRSYNSRVNKPVKERARIVTQRANRFSFRGTLSDRARQMEAERKKVSPAEPELTYAAFKKKEA